MQIEKVETARTYSFVLQKLRDVENRLVAIIPELVSLDDFKSITEISTIITQVKSKADEYKLKQDQLSVPSGTFKIAD